MKPRKIKHTGIVRRVDDLGRIAIPKAIRQELGIQDFDLLEYFIFDGQLVLRKYVVEAH